jgi:hypothetical protein
VTGRRKFSFRSEQVFDEVDVAHFGEFRLES